MSGFVPLGEDGDGAAAPGMGGGAGDQPSPYPGNTGQFEGGGSAELGLSAPRGTGQAAPELLVAGGVLFGTVLSTGLCLGAIGSSHWLTWKEQYHYTGSDGQDFDYWRLGLFHSCVQYSNHDSWHCRGVSSADMLIADKHHFGASRFFGVVAAIEGLIACFLAAFVLLLVSKAPGAASFAAFNATRTVVLAIVVLNAVGALCGLISMWSFATSPLVVDAKQNITEGDIENEKLDGRLASGYGALVTSWIFMAATAGGAYYQWNTLSD